VVASEVVQHFSVHPGLPVKTELRYGPDQNIVLTDAKGTILVASTFSAGINFMVVMKRLANVPAC